MAAKKKISYIMQRIFFLKYYSYSDGIKSELYNKKISCHCCYQRPTKSSISRDETYSDITVMATSEKVPYRKI